MTTGIRTIEFPEGRYLAVSTTRSPFDSDAYQSAELAVSEAAAMVDLLFPNVIADKEFEGFVNSPRQSVVMEAGPRSIIAMPDPPIGDLERGLLQMSSSLSGQSTEDQERFQLACRWYMRGLAADNPVDKLLSWFIALEVHPTHGVDNFCGSISEYLQSNVFPDLTPSVVKVRSQIGRIFGLRADIVHHGKSHISFIRDRDYLEKLRCLEAIVRVCLRCLAGLPDSGFLDHWMRPELDR